MNLKSLSIVRVTILISIIAHAVLFWILARNKQQVLTGRMGRVAVEVVFAAEHGEPDKKGGSRPKARKAQVGRATPGAIAVADKGTFDNYVGQVMLLMDKFKLYPPESLEREEEGRVVIGLTIHEDGSISGTTLEEKSPFDLLNAAALKTIERIGKFPPLDPGIAAPLHLHVPLVFKIQRH